MTEKGTIDGFPPLSLSPPFPPTLRLGLSPLSETPPRGPFFFFLSFFPTGFDEAGSPSDAAGSETTFPVFLAPPFVSLPLPPSLPGNGSSPLRRLAAETVETWKGAGEQRGGGGEKKKLAAEESWTELVGGGAAHARERSLPEPLGNFFVVF